MASTTTTPPTCAAPRIRRWPTPITLTRPPALTDHSPGQYSPGSSPIRASTPNESKASTITSAIEQWEPRFRVTRIEVVKVTRDGQLHVFLEGEYRPRAVVGDFTVEGARRLDAYANPDGLLIEERLTS